MKATKMKTVGCRFDFFVLVSGGISQGIVDSHAPMPNSRVITTTFNTQHYAYDYDDAIVRYYKACGCKIIDWDWYIFNDGFILKHTKPTIAVDAEEWWDKEYSHGKLPFLTDQQKVLLVLVVTFIVILLLNFGDI